MKKFRYLIDCYSSNDFYQPEFMNRINELGKNGWELCSLVDNRNKDGLFYLLFKSEIDDLESRQSEIDELVRFLDAIVYCYDNNEKIDNDVKHIREILKKYQDD